MLDKHEHDQMLRRVEGTLPKDNDLKIPTSGATDWTPHLQYADFLEENGHPAVAEVIRQAHDQTVAQNGGLSPLWSIGRRGFGGWDLSSGHPDSLGFDVSSFGSHRDQRHLLVHAPSPTNPKLRLYWQMIGPAEHVEPLVSSLRGERLPEYDENYDKWKESKQQMSRRGGKKRYARVPGEDLLPFLDTVIHQQKRTFGGRGVSDAMKHMADYLEENGMPTTAEVIRWHHASDVPDRNLLPISNRVRDGDSNHDVRNGEWQVRSYATASPDNGRRIVEVYHCPINNGPSDRAVGWLSVFPKESANEVVDNLLAEGHKPHTSIQFLHPDLYAKYENGEYGPQQMSRKGGKRRYNVQGLDSEERQLHQSIQEGNRKNPEPSLRYADWLEENGKPVTASLIRLHQEPESKVVLHSGVDSFYKFARPSESRANPVFVGHGVTRENGKHQVYLSMKNLADPLSNLEWGASFSPEEAEQIHTDLSNEWGLKPIFNQRDTSNWSAKEGHGDLASGPVWEVRDHNNRWVLGVPRATSETPDKAIRRAERITRHKMSCSSSPRRYAADDSQSVSTAMTGAMSANQQSTAEIAKDIMTNLRLLPAVGTDAVHSTPQGSRPSMVVKLQTPRPSKAVYAASWMGLMTRQPGQVVFMPGKGPDLMHTLTSSLSGRDLTRALASVGVQDSTLIPKNTGIQAMVYDPESRLGAALREMSQRMKVHLKSQPGHGTFVGGSKEDDARAAYRRVIRDYEARLQDSAGNSPPQQQGPRQAPPNAVPDAPRHMRRGGVRRYAVEGQESEESKFHRAIQSDPKNRDHVLQYADWLEEHGKPGMATVIRLHNGTGREYPEHGDDTHILLRPSASIGHKFHASLTSRRYPGKARVVLHLPNLSLPPESRGANSFAWQIVVPKEDVHQLTENLFNEGAMPVSDEAEDMVRHLRVLKSRKCNVRRYSRYHIDAMFRDGLGMPREKLPQVPDSHKERLLMTLLRKRVGHWDDEVNPDLLKPSQGEWDPKSLQRVRDSYHAGGSEREKLVNNRVTVSKDGYVLDGHHRWLHARLQGRRLKVVVVDLPIKKLIKAASEFGEQNGIARKSV